MADPFGVLSEEDLASVLEVLPELYAANALEDLPRLALSTVRRLVRCEMATYDEWTLERGRVTGYRLFKSAEADAFDPLMPTIAARLDEHPLFPALESRSKRPEKISDYVSTDAFKRGALYNDTYRSIHIDHQMAWFLPESDEPRVCIVLSRDRKDFSEVDRFKLALLAPHLRQAHTNAKRFSELRTRGRLLQSALRSAALEPIFLDEQGRPLELSERAMAWLRTYFQDGSANDPWPQTLGEWVRPQLDGTALFVPPPLIVERGPTRLSVNVHRETGGKTLLILTESAIDPLPARIAGFAGAHRLTRRETEVLELLARGESNKAIADRLGCGVRTVEVHVTHVLEKAGVDRRSELIAALWR
jgi:DNA-binding CsgD family transcriptional regulator/type II secretory pathway pseudopilin PulG